MGTQLKFVCVWIRLRKRKHDSMCVCLGVMCTHGTCCCQWGENSKFNSLYYYGLIPEITNKERFAQQSHHTNDNEYHKKRGSVNTQFPTFLLNAHIYSHHYTHLLTHFVCVQTHNMRIILFFGYSVFWIINTVLSSQPFNQYDFSRRGIDLTKILCWK